METTTAPQGTDNSDETREEPFNPPARTPAWIRRSGFITALDYNLHPVNAVAYGSATDWDALRRGPRRRRPGAGPPT